MARFLGETKSWNGQPGELPGEGDDDLGMEIMGIFAQPSRKQEGILPPPSRNSNPLVKDKRFSKDRADADRDALTSSLANSLASQAHLDGRDKRSSSCDLRTPSH